MKSLHSPSFLPTILAALQKNEIAPQLLELEITETTAMSDPEHTFAILTTIRSFGIRVSIDDFGTGFSSLSHLHRLPVDTIKIDRSFVHNMTAVGDDAALVSAIVGMAITLRKHVVAEGVETELQRAQLLMFGCHEAQGFLFAKPVHPNVFARMLAEEPNPALA